MDYATVMTRKKVEKKDEPRVKGFGGTMNAVLVDAFTATIPIDSVGIPRYKKKQVLARAMQLWIDLPPEIREDLLSKPLRSSALLDLVQKVVDDTIAAGQAAGQEVRKRQKQKRRQAGGSGSRGR